MVRFVEYSFTSMNISLTQILLKYAWSIRFQSVARGSNAVEMREGSRLIRNAAVEHSA